MTKPTCELRDGYLVLYSKDGGEFLVSQGCDVEAYLRKGYSCEKPAEATPASVDEPVKRGRGRHVDGD